MMEKEMVDYHSKSIEEIFKKLETSGNGLTEKQAEEKIKKFGKNIIRKTHKLRPARIFFEQFKSFLIYILIIAALITFLIGHNIDGIVISAIVVLNTTIGFFQQYKAEKTIIHLKKMIISKSRVIRNGIMKEIPSEELVPGDILILNSGDRINADCRIIETENLETNEAALTGESLPVEKNARILPEKTALAERKNMLFAGTQVVAGDAKAVVISTGEATAFGKIAETIQEIDVPKTPIQKRLDKFSKQVGLVILGIIGIIFILGSIKQIEPVEMFLTAAALGVSAIPEGLPAVLVISFAISSLLMSRNKVAIRRLPAVESLGSVTVICSDKTGTMTEEKMSVQKIFSNDKLFDKKGKKIFLKNRQINPKESNELFMLLKTSILCNNARFEVIKDKYEIIGDPTEQALVANSLDLGLNKKIMIEKEPGIKKFEFNSKRKMMSVVRDTGRNYVIYSKGAIEKILSVCGSELVNGQIKQLTDKRKNQLLENSKKMEMQALRVLAFAYRNIPKKQKPEEKGLIFLGFVGMLDPPRIEVREAVSLCTRAGIKVKMITGDSEITAKAIAEQIGMQGRTITGQALKNMNDSELSRVIDEIAIFARTTPDQKLRITKILQKKGEIVAITGDGINDALALKSADIGIAMGKRGTDVARDVSDIILIDDNFTSIVKGVKEGRRNYDNIKKFTKYFLAVNFSEIVLILTALMLNLPPPLLPLQILWINLVTDSLPALSLVFEKEENVMKTPPRKEKSILNGTLNFVIVGGFLAFLTEIVIYFIGINQGIAIEKTRTMVLTTAILFELFFVYSCRSIFTLNKIGFFSNKFMNYAVLISAGLHLILLYTTLRTAFGVVPLGISDWLLILPLGISGLVLFEIGKYLKEKNILFKKEK